MMQSFRSMMMIFPAQRTASRGESDALVGNHWKSVKVEKEKDKRIVLSRRILLFLPLFSFIDDNKIKSC